MDCSYFSGRINNYIDGELGYVEVAELQQHISFCPSCATELARVSEVRVAMAAWGQLELAPSPDFAERVMSAVKLEPIPGTPRPIAEVVDDVLQKLDDALGRVPLPGGHYVPVRNVIGWSLAAAAAVGVELERRHLRHVRRLKTL
jgi:anti-sigma factor RsiW